MYGGVARERENHGRIFAFKLGGTAGAAPPKRSAGETPELPRSHSTPTHWRTAAGFTFATYCVMCHAGRGDDEPGAYPQLVRMNAATHAASTASCRRKARERRHGELRGRARASRRTGHPRVPLARTAHAQATGATLTPSARFDSLERTAMIRRVLISWLCRALPLDFTNSSMFPRITVDVAGGRSSSE